MALITSKLAFDNKAARVKEVQADSVAYLVVDALGLE
jgi:hypothetical protein